MCIVGGGFTGLWTAYRLRELEPGIAVAVVEADLCGSGASGRNGGGVSHWWGKLPTLVRVLGADDAMALVRASVDAIDGIGRFCDAHGVECHFRTAPSLWAATAPAQVGAWDAVLGTAWEIGVETPYRELSAEELDELAPPYLAGVLQERAHQVQPALLARGLRRVVAGSGTEVYERSPVTRIAGTGPLAVQTPAGRVVADRVVLAANAWMAHLPEFRRWIMVVSSDVIATEPIPERLAQLGLDRRPGGLNSRLMVNYYKPSPDGRIVLGRGGGTLSFANRIAPALHGSERQAREVREDFDHLFPELRDVRITHSWAGPVDRSSSGLPRFGRLTPRIHYAMGYTGHGVGASALGGRILAAQVLDRDEEIGPLLHRVPHARFPPEPARYLGGLLVRRAVARKERAEREGRIPARVDVALARLAPGTYTDVRRGRR